MGPLGPHSGVRFLGGGFPGILDNTESRLPALTAAVEQKIPRMGAPCLDHMREAVFQVFVRLKSNAAWVRHKRVVIEPHKSLHVRMAAQNGAGPSAPCPPAKTRGP